MFIRFGYSAGQWTRVRIMYCLVYNYNASSVIIKHYLLHDDVKVRPQIIWANHVKKFFIGIWTQLYWSEGQTDSPPESCFIDTGDWDLLVRKLLLLYVYLMQV